MLRTCRPLRCALPLPRLAVYAPRARLVAMVSHCRYSHRVSKILEIPKIYFPRFKDPDGAETEFFNNNNNNKNDKIDPYQQQRLANLGTIIEIIKHHVPQLLQQPLPKEIISDSITLRVLPITHPSLPAAQGRVAYNAVFKTLQLFCSSVLLPPNSKLAILAARLPPPEDDHATEFTRRRFVVRWRSENSNLESRHHQQQQGAYPDSFSSLGAEGGGGAAEAFAPQQLARTLGLLSHEYPVLTGLFEFVFDRECTQIVEIVISNVEYISREQDVKCVPV